MKDYSVVINSDKDFLCSFPRYLFNEKEQLDLQSELCKYTFHLIQNSSGISFARFSCFVQEDHCYSPYKAPFGSIELDENLQLESLQNFIKEIEIFLSSKNIKKLDIISYPSCYNPSGSALLTYCLLESGYSISVSELNYHLTLDHSSFESKIHISEKRKLKKCLKEKFHCKIESNPDVASIYNLIKTSRESKGYPLTISQDSLQKVLSGFPERYVIFTLYNDRDELISSAIGVKVSPEILYYFLPSHDERYNTLSPILVIIKGMYEYCFNNNFKIFDLGIATAKGVPNYGLMRFKKNIGGIPSGKFSFTKNIKA